MRNRLPLPILLAGGLSSACAGRAPATGPRPVPVVIAIAAQKDVPVQIQAIGTVEPMQTVQVRTQVTGTLVGVHFREGQEVKRGDLLFTLDPRPYQAALAQAQSAVARDRAKLLDAESNARRLTELAQKEYVTAQQAESARKGPVRRPCLPG